MGRFRMGSVALLLLAVGLAGAPAWPVTPRTRAEAPAPREAATGRDRRAVSFGHNLTASGHLLPAGDCSMGVQALACGIREQVTVGTSPWLIADYNLINFYTRARIRETARTRDVLQAAYFKDFDYRYSERRLANGPYYQMESVWLTWIRRYQFNGHYDFHWNLGVQYYPDLTRPWSLRRPDSHLNPWQLTATTLHEVNMEGPVFLVAEVGFLGAIQGQPYLHTGATLQYRGKNILLQLGYSLTSTFTAQLSPAARTDCQQAILQSGGTYEGTPYPSCEPYDYAIHPEFALQVQF